MRGQYVMGQKVPASYVVSPNNKQRRLHKKLVKKT